MSDALHAGFRARIALDDVDDATDEHLGQCDECARFVTDLARLRALSPSLVPAAPDGFAERATARFRTVAPPTGRPIVRKRWTVAAVAAAVALVLAAVGIVVRQETTESTPEEVLLIAAERAEEAGGADVEVVAEAGVEVAAESAPDFGAVPTELQGYLTQRWAEVTAQAQLQINENLRRAQEQLEQSMRNIPLPRRGSAPTPPPPPPRRAVSLSTSIRATGRLDFGRAVRLDGQVSTDAAGSTPQPFALRSGASVGVVAAAGAEGSVTPGGGPLGELLLRPAAVADLLRNPIGPVTAVGEGEVAGGVAVRRYALVVADPADPAARWNVEAAVDGDGLPRRLRVRAGGDLGASETWTADVTVTLSGFSAAGRTRAEAPDPRAPAPAPAATAPSKVLYPFGPAVSASLKSATR